MKDPYLALRMWQRLMIVNAACLVALIQTTIAAFLEDFQLGGYLDPVTGEWIEEDDGNPEEYDDTGEANDPNNPTWSDEEQTSQSGEAN